MESIHVLLVEDSQGIREYLTELIEINGYNAHVLIEKREFLTELHRLGPDLILLGPSTHMGRVRAFSEVLEREKSGTPILVISDGKDGASDIHLHQKANVSCLSNGFDAKCFKEAIQRLVDEARHSCHKQLDSVIIGKTPGMILLKRHLIRLAKSDVTILITGESGTGKELVARAIHKISSRASKPFVKVNSAALPSNLLESELFGYEKGAFTGAVAKKPGKFELAHSGTIFLDEVGEIPLPMQAKLLQVLQDNEYSALGSTNNTKVDTRILAATNANLTRMVASGGFRSDLFYRLNVISLHVPPLRERREDIIPLCDHFLRVYSERYGKTFEPFHDDIRERFYRHSWPGNVRELESSIQSIIVLGYCKESRQHIGNLPESIFPLNHGHPPYATRISATHSISFSHRSLKNACKDAVKKAETDAIMDVLFHTQWNRRKAATFLQISYKALLNKIKEYGIERKYRKVGKTDEIDLHEKNLSP